MTLIDKAILDDIPQLCELLGLLFEQEEDFQPHLEKQAAGLHTIIENPELGAILVIRDGGSILGMINLLYTVSTACGGRVSILEDLIVRPGNRGCGLGTLIVLRAIDVARKQGCLRITLLTDKTNESALRFYQRHGFKPSEMIALRLLL